MLKQRNIILFFASILIVIGGCGKNNQSQQAQNQQTPMSTQGSGQMGNGQNEQTSQSYKNMVTIPSMTHLVVTLNETIETNSNHAGDHFYGTLAGPVVVDGKTAIPEGSKVEMVITSLVKGGRLKTAPEIEFTIANITLPNGDSYPVSSSSIYDKGRSHTTREVGMIGGGAAAGAIIGGVLGEGKGAAIGGAAGAAAGTGAAAATGRQNLVYAAGKSLTFSLKQPLSLQQ